LVNPIEQQLEGQKGIGKKPGLAHPDYTGCASDGMRF